MEKSSEIPIVGFLHICQKTHWEKSFDIIFNIVKSNGLYENSSVIYCVIVNDYGEIIDDDRFHQDKIKLVYAGHSSIYERATMYFMRELSEKCEPSYYWYAHTKGISHYGSNIEENVIDWIVFMCYWNFKLWRKAINTLENVDVCGCNFLQHGTNPHFSGNFWWAKSDYVKKLPTIIDDSYWAPEFWVFKANPSFHELCNSHVDQYSSTYKPHRYEIQE